MFFKFLLFINVIKIALSAFPTVLDLSLENFVQWPNATVPFYINTDHFDKEQSLTILTALALFAFKTCVKFAPILVPPKANQHVMLFQNPKGLNQCILDGKGHSVDEPHLVSIGYDCLRSPLLEMMIMRGLGFSFEHNRMSRDLYVDVQFENVEPGYLELFTKDVLALPMELRNLPYDINSAMHFCERAFSKNGHKTIIIKDHKTKQNRVGLTDTDIRKIELVYGPECRRRDRLEKMELCQSYPGVVRRKREVPDYRRKSLRINPDITAPPDTVVEESTNTVTVGTSNTPKNPEESPPYLKELGLQEEVQEILDKIYKLSVKALEKTRSKYCNATKENVRPDNNTSSDIFGIVDKIQEFTMSMVDHALNNLTEFCEEAESLANYERSRCDIAECTQRYHRPTKVGLSRHSTQNRPVLHQNTQINDLTQKPNIYDDVLRMSNDNSNLTTVVGSVRKKRDVSAATESVTPSVKVETSSVFKITTNTNKLDSDGTKMVVDPEIISEAETKTEKGFSTAGVTLENNEKKFNQTVVDHKSVSQNDSRIAEESKQNFNVTVSNENNILNASSIKFNAGVTTDINKNNYNKTAVEYRTGKLVLQNDSRNAEESTEKLNVTVSNETNILNASRRKFNRDSQHVTKIYAEVFHSDTDVDEPERDEIIKENNKKMHPKRDKVKNDERTKAPYLITIKVQYSQEDSVKKYSEDENTKRKKKNKPSRSGKIESSEKKSAEYGISISRENEKMEDISEPGPQKMVHKKLRNAPIQKHPEDSLEYQHKNYKKEQENLDNDKKFASNEDSSVVKGVNRKKVTEENSLIAKKVKRKGLAPKTIKLSKENTAFYNDRKWPDGIIKYIITNDERYDLEDLRTRLEEVNMILKKKTCVRLHEITSDDVDKYNDYLVLDTSADYVTGRVGGKQIFGALELFLGGQHKQYTAMMVMAMLGFYFEVSRHDRDKYIRVHTRHIRPDKLHHFEKIREDATFNLPYDFKSATHPAWQFWRQIGKTGISTVATYKNKDPDGEVMKMLGQNDQLLSDLDILKINSVYGTKCFDSLRNRTFRRGQNRRSNKKQKNGTVKNKKKKKLNRTLIIF